MAEQRPFDEYELSAAVLAVEADRAPGPVALNAAMEAAIEVEIDAAVEFALASAFPELAEMARDVYAEGVAA